MLPVRLKALDQIAKVCGLSVEQRAEGFAPLPCATPDDVRWKVLGMDRRESDVLRSKSYESREWGIWSLEARFSLFNSSDSTINLRMPVNVLSIPHEKDDELVAVDAPNDGADS